MRGEINLLKNELKERGPLNLGGGKNLIPLYISIGLLIIEALVIGGFLYNKKSLGRETNAAEVEASLLDLEMRQTDDKLKEAISYQARLSNFKNLLNSHIFWSPIFEELAKYTYKPIRFDTFQGDTQKNRIVVTGTGSSYREIAKLILGLKKSDKFRDILFQSGGVATGDKAGFGFLLDIGIDPKLMKK